MLNTLAFFRLICSGMHTYAIYSVGLICLRRWESPYIERSRSNRKSATTDSSVEFVKPLYQFQSEFSPLFRGRILGVINDKADCVLGYHKPLPVKDLRGGAHAPDRDSIPRF